MTTEQAPLVAAAVIHPQYLPFTTEQLARHFAPVLGAGVGDKLAYYVKSAKRNLRHMDEHQHPMPAGAKLCSALDHQVEKDERFWVVSALMALFYGVDRIAGLTSLLTAALGATPPKMSGLDSWAEALGDPDELQLYFEVSLPAPPTYKRWLGKHQEGYNLLPYLLARAAGKGLEGATKVDAMLVAPATGFAVALEAKVLSDASSHTMYNARRNQIARNIDVLLDSNENVQSPLKERRPERTCFVLLTPEVFRKDPSTRLYGSLMESYTHCTTLLRQHLPHRDEPLLSDVPGRIGWTTWEQCRRILPTACEWLGAPELSASNHPDQAFDRHRTSCSACSHNTAVSAVNATSSTVSTTVVAPRSAPTDTRAASAAG